jgi:hypothetical protein
VEEQVAQGVGDAHLTVVLGRFARLAAHALEDPAAWLGSGAPPPSAGLLGRARGAAGIAGRLVVGRMHPGVPGWQQLPVQDRCQWWLRRIGAVVVPIAATPRIAGGFADRLPLQAALGAAAAGLAICAVAREHGLERPEDWVPLLGRVLFGRDLTRPAAVPSLEEASTAAAGAAADEERPPPAGIARRVASGLWRLAGILWTLPDVFDDRPRGALLWRTLGRVPVVGLAAGVLDERGAVRRAADETREQLVSPR